MESNRLPNQELILRYKLPGFNYRLYIGLIGSQVQMGFVEYSGSVFQEYGCRVLLPILLQGSVNKTLKKLESI
ncbi:hypothetical protein HDV02_001712 [Globomyces sp. JEL0801]|nr:hypothetical protein HDV02_001712 [Globomyces sp. JEL0801]